ncbi:TPA: PTS lactose/cellobiose transporter subunit IIA [Clostridioides difficile]
METRTEISVILIHAQDHLMNGMNFQQLAEEIVDLHLKLQDK